MSFFFNKSFHLKQIIPNGYIDIHNHILPGIDDGSKNIEETKSMIDIMRKINISGAVATPHTSQRYWSNRAADIENSYINASKHPTVNSFILGYASEYMLDNNLMDLVTKEKLLCIYDNYILLELPFYKNPQNLFEMLFELKCRNYKIILAHPERYPYFYDSFLKFEKLKEFEILFQLNLLSLTNYYGKKISQVANNLMIHDFYDFSGTDIHNENQVELLLIKPLLVNQNKLGDLLLKNKIFINI